MMMNTAEVRRVSSILTSHAIVRTFLMGARHPQYISDNQAVIYASLRCYSKYKIYECNAEIAIPVNFGDSDHLMLLDGDQLLFETYIIDLLEYDDIIYSFGRTKNVLIAEREGMPPGRFHRIDLEELS
ncbi:hypothetical protein WBG78_04195 [Chryseolinea sp. T2]|uniref:hypothetical protein n=1 Tax=Chryseolinea sp. T2 TaxID=3129255 RepID=UPI003077D28C